MTKTDHIQIRVSRAQKARLKALAKKSGLGMSQWVLARILPPEQEEWAKLIRELGHSPKPRFVLSGINHFLTRLSSEEFAGAVGWPPVRLDPYWSNYIAAMVECAAHQKKVQAPDWVSGIRPLDRPVFGTDLQSLRLHLLTEAPPPFRNRNIFIDSTLGDSV